MLHYVPQLLILKDNNIFLEWYAMVTVLWFFFSFFLKSDNFRKNLFKFDDEDIFSNCDLCDD